jgi:beta-phosphoglucomutase
METMLELNDNMSTIYKGFISDLDGTLCDTLEANLLSYEKAFSDAGLKFDKKSYMLNFGLRFNDMVQKISPEATTEQKELIKKQKAIYYKENAGLVKPNINLIKVLKCAKKSGIKIGIASTAREENAKEILSKLQLFELFDDYIFGDDVINGKPDSECYDKIIKKLNLKPEECLVFEDSEIGIIAAQKSGASVLRISL